MARGIRMLRNVDIKPLYNVLNTPYTKNSPITFGLFFKCTPAPILPSGEPRQGVVLHHAQLFPVFNRVSIPIYANVFAIIELLKKIRIFLYQLRIV